MKSHPSALRDFTVDRRVWLLSAVAIVIGIGAASSPSCSSSASPSATNLFYFHRFSLASVTPADSPLGHWMPLVPIVGGLIVGFMARYGSDKIRGHGIPEAIEAILLHGAPHPAQDRHPQAHLRRHRHRLRRPLRRGRPHHHDRRRIRLAHRPVDPPHRRRAHHPARSRSLRRHVRHLRLPARRHPPRRRTPALRVASPQPRSRRLRQRHRRHPARLLARLRPALPHARAARPADRLSPSPPWLSACIIGCRRRRLEPHDVRLRRLSSAIFRIHWMWWPALGGIGIGIGGIFFPRGLGVGYDNIADLLHGNVPLALILGLISPSPSCGPSPSAPEPPAASSHRSS